jgi:hypothetical protein
MSQTVYDPEPQQKWKRKNYDISDYDRLSLREKSEKETNKDLDKSVEQLVCDVHEETNNPERAAIQNIAHAQKRMVSMMARVAISNNKLSRWVLILSIITLFSGSGSLLLSIMSYANHQAKEQTDILKSLVTSVELQKMNLMLKQSIEDVKIQNKDLLTVLNSCEQNSRSLVKINEDLLSEQEANHRKISEILEQHLKSHREK